MTYLGLHTEFKHLSFLFSLETHFVDFSLYQKDSVAEEVERRKSTNDMVYPHILWKDLFCWFPHWYNKVYWGFVFLGSDILMSTQSL